MNVRLRDRSATFKPDNGAPVINTFTVTGAYIAGDHDKCLLINSQDVLAGLKPVPDTLHISAGDPMARRVEVFPFVGLPGDTVLTLTGGAGFEVWGNRRGLPLRRKRGLYAPPNGGKPPVWKAAVRMRPRRGKPAALHTTTRAVFNFYSIVF